MQFLDTKQEKVLGDLRRLAGGDSRILNLAIRASAAANSGRANLSDVVKRIQELRAPKKPVAA